MRQLDVTSDLQTHERTAAGSCRQEFAAVEVLAEVIGKDPGLAERHLSMRDRSMLTTLDQPVSPSDVHLARPEVWPAHEMLEERSIAGAAAHEDRCLGQGPAQTGHRLITVAAVGDDLRDHRVELGGDLVALLEARVDSQPRPTRKAEQLDLSRSGREVAIAVLRVEPSLDGVANLCRRLTFKPLARRDAQLELHEIEPCGDLRDRVLDLEPGVHLHEHEAGIHRVVEELHRPRVGVADGGHETGGGRADLCVLLYGERRRRRFLDQLLMAPLYGAVSHSDRPHRSVVVGDDLDFDVPGGRHHLLEEERVVAEGLERLGSSGSKGAVELSFMVDPADAATTTARGRFDHDRIAETRRLTLRSRQRRDRAVAPGRDGDPGGFGDALGHDLVAGPPHRVR